MGYLQMRRLGCLYYLTVLLPPNRSRHTSVHIPAQRSPAQILEVCLYLLAVRLEPVRSLLKQPRPSGGAEVSLPPNDMGGVWG